MRSEQEEKQDDGDILLRMTLVLLKYRGIDVIETSEWIDEVRSIASSLPCYNKDEDYRFGGDSRERERDHNGDTIYYS